MNAPYENNAVCMIRGAPLIVVNVRQDYKMSFSDEEAQISRNSF